MPEKTLRCAGCHEEFTDAETENVNCCPACGTRSVPMLIKQDLLVPLNWHELRCLVQWADNYVVSCAADPDWERMWERLKAKINKHKPEGAAPLTLFEELQEMRDAGFDVTLHEGKGRSA